MTEKRIQFNNIIQNQLPTYVREEFPLVAEFLKQYYISQEFKGAPTDLIQNIDQYIKLDIIKKDIESVVLSEDISFSDEVIVVSSPSGTQGFPDSYGLLQIDSEIITYTGKTTDSFTGCIRGFGGITSYNDLTFSLSEAENHVKDSVITNLSSILLKEFFKKIKYQISPGFEDREFYSEVDKYLFLKQSKDFYSTRGTEESFKILFKVLYGENVKLIKPQEQIIKPSNSLYAVNNYLVVESIEGDPLLLKNSTLFQDEYEDFSNKSYAPISNIERIVSVDGKEYYKLGFDSGYNKDLIVSGSLYGNFYAHPTTKIIGKISPGDKSLDVDSTIGFPSSGELSVKYANGIKGTIKYTSKNINQFFGCSNIEFDILDGSDVYLNTYARNYDNSIKVRITSVLKNVEIFDDTYYQFSGDTCVIKNLGIDVKNQVSNNIISNTSTSFNVKNIEIANLQNRIYRVTTLVTNNLKIGDLISIITNDGTEYNSEVVDVISEKIFVAQVEGTINTLLRHTVKRKLLKVNHLNYVGLSSEISDVQNIYHDKNKSLIASPSLPNYISPLETTDRSVTFDISISAVPQDTFFIGNHLFYTGDLVYYKPGTVELFEEGLYYVKRESNTSIKLAKSKSNIYSSIFVSVSDIVTDSKNNFIVDYKNYNKSLQSQKLLREISQPINEEIEYETEPGPIGIFANGVELLNYKSTDEIYYGPIESIDVIDKGSNYDIITPPNLNISDPVGYGATGYCSIKGSLQEIRIIDPGFDYIEIPKIEISGGNGTGAKAKVSMKKIKHQVSFNAESSSALVSLVDNTIGFSTFSRFKNVEKVIYKTEGQTAVGGLSTDSSYFISKKDEYRVKIHKSFDDAISGINTISLTSFGTGVHILESIEDKLIVDSIEVEDSGENYENKKRTAKTSDIITYLNHIRIKNHGFETGEIVNYSTTGTPIGGLSPNTDYYVTKIDNDNFKLSQINSNQDDKDFYYRTNQYIEITSVGSGIHIFNYPKITVNIVGSVGISSIGSNTFQAKIQPIFRGEITSVHLENSGVGYGSSEILNFRREPSITLNTGSGCELTPVINNGKIVQVLINNGGKDYNSPPNLSVIGEVGGIGAVLTPILEDGKVVSVNVIQGGTGYVRNKTRILVEASGSGFKSKANIQSWTVNLVSKYFKNFKDVVDDGFLFHNPGSNYGLQYSHLYSPRKLRENVYSREVGNQILYGEFDLKISESDSTEIPSNLHSPIIGWAYDGNPIYGPYGYSKKNGGTISQMKSGYIQKLKDNRPPFPSGFFVEDYEYSESDDDTILDEFNGRFCVTPDFPNGTYAYFSTLSQSADSATFSGYKIPSFPYIIGNKFKSTPNKFNFKNTSNQDDIDLNNSDWIRNTNLYNIGKDELSYHYISTPNQLNQTADIKYTSPGSIDKIEIESSGDNYKIDDTIIFDEEGTGGFGFSSKISRISGKKVESVSVATTTFYNFEFYPSQTRIGSFTVQSDSPHSFSEGEIINVSGLTTTTSLPQGFYTITGISTNNFAISDPSGLGNISSTGIATYISVSGNIAFSNVRENDIFVIGNERIKILNVDRNSSRIRILRGVDGTVGTSHSYSDIMYEVPRRFSVSSGTTSLLNYKLNKEIYFDPKESLGIGTISGVGIGTTIFISNPGVGITQIFIPTKTIYLPNHNLETGDEVTYFTNDGTGIIVSSVGIGTTILSNQTKLYVAKISDNLIGIATVRVGLGSTGTFVGISSTTSSYSTLFLAGIGTGSYHSFKTNYPKLVGQISKDTVTVSLDSSHGLLEGDEVFMNVKSGISTRVVVKYDDTNRRILINPRKFNSDDIDSENGTIRIVNHNFTWAQKVSFSSTQPLGELVNNKIYYAVIYDKDTIKLANSLYDANRTIPQTIGIGSTSQGVLSPINPPIKVYENSPIIFDVSDESLSYSSALTKFSAFKLNFYTDQKFTKIFETSIVDNNFEVQRSGRIGIDTNATVSLNVKDSTPKKLYYNLVPLLDSNIPKEKLEIISDETVYENNTINIAPSSYSGNYKIIPTTPTSFSYVLAGTPEVQSYNPSNSTLSYETTSNNTSGAISKITITTKGQNYRSLPKFSKVISSEGKDALLRISSNSIGKIQKLKINDIGFDFPSDTTLKPNLSLPQILSLNPLNSIESIGITSTGKNYLYPAKLIVLDGKTNNLITDFDLEYSLGDSEVTILRNSYNLSDIEPIIIPTQNSNGVGISSIYYDSISQNVTIELSVGFSTTTTFPFSVGDRILVENVNVDDEENSLGYNSKNYGYQLFTLNGVDENIGGFGKITYSMSEYLDAGKVPGTFNEELSSGRVIPEKHFPIFKPVLKIQDFYKKEKVKYVGEERILGVVEGWDRKSKQLRISSREIINPGNLIKGLSSKTEGLIEKSENFDSFIHCSAYSKEQGKSETNIGFLNDDLQRLQDSFYYQNFSYSLRSRVPYQKWEDAVGSLNHTSGFKKFSDLQVESLDYCGINTDVISNVDLKTDIYSLGDLNCVYDFDFARENSIQLDSTLLSDRIILKNNILTDYFELISKSVVKIDDISSQFVYDDENYTYIAVDRFELSDITAKKYILCIKDRRYAAERQAIIVSLLQDEENGYLNQYARTESYTDLGSFDYRIEGDEGVLLFYPIKNVINDYDITFFSYNIKNSFSGIGSTSLGGIVDISSKTTNVSLGSTTTVVSIASTYTSSKVTVVASTNLGEYQYNELSLINNGTNVYLLEYGELLGGSEVGLGTYNAYLSGSNLNVDFIPRSDVEASVSSVQVSIANTTYTGIGTINLNYSNTLAKTTSIPSSINPTFNTISENFSTYYGAYHIVQISDLTNNQYELAEIIVLDSTLDFYINEFGNLRTNVGLGTFTVERNGSKTSLKFKPLKNIQTQVKVYSNYISDVGSSEGSISLETSFNENSLGTNGKIYYGLESERNQSFVLYTDNYPIFKKTFEGENPSIVDIENNIITIPNHFFSSGERVKYSYGDASLGALPISISETDFGVGIGTTSTLPETVYIIKLDQNTVQIARNVEESLSAIPIPVNFTSVGLGVNHSFSATNQNSKCLIAVDNIIQSPIISTASTSKLVSQLLPSEDFIYVDNEKIFFIGDLIKINNEIVEVRGVGIGSTNSILVRRERLGTSYSTHSSGTTISKVSGSYNIVDNTLYFSSPPYGLIPTSSELNPPDEKYWVGVSTSSTFQGRVLLKSGIEDSSDETYSKNYIFDDISSQFNGGNKSFTLTSNGSNIDNISSQGGIVLINDIFQEPGSSKNYTITEEVVGITSLTFVGTAVSAVYDVNTASLPRGGVLVSVGSTFGFGYQPLVSAGATAIVSIAGTISAISIGNSGSGYRTSIQTPDGIKPITVKVGIATSSVETPNIEFIGTATVSNGNIVSIAITNPGTGYTSSNPPYVIIDPPVPYSNIPLIHTDISAGVGTESTIDIVVGQGSSVINFELKNLGYNYSIGDVLTVPTGGLTGIPTVSNYQFDRFEISVQQIFTDKFNGWSVGELQTLDSIERFFNDKRTIFPLSYQGSPIGIYPKRGSNISPENNLIVILNSILQNPGESYIFDGGTEIQFTEAPKKGDTCSIVFYKGNGEGVDVIFTEVFETVKVGDEVTLTYDSNLGQSPSLLEEPRTVTSVFPSDLKTNSYFGPGNTEDETLYRPLTWCRQTEDKVIDGLEVPKDRKLYEPSINPTSYLIKNVSIGSTVIYVDNIRPFFDSKNENQISLDFQKNVSLISKNILVSASATSIVSTGGTISSIIVSNGGFGYEFAPDISIQSPTGITSITTKAVSSISSGIVTSITITGVVTGYSQQNPPIVLIAPPRPKVEKNSVRNYEGDSGVIVGFGTTTLGTYNHIIFDLYIPDDSYLKNIDYVDVPLAQSSLNEGDFFVAFDTNVGVGTILSSVELNGNNLGISTQYIDNVYQVSRAETILTNITGVGLDYIRRVFCRVVGLGTINFTSSNITFDSNIYTFDSIETESYSSGISTSNYFGRYSWGKIGLKSRTKQLSFDSNVSIGKSISSSTEVVRLIPLKDSNYVL